MIVHGECIEAMRGMDAGSVDAIVTDPPYGLGFMGKRWDDLPPGREWADECLRVLKPGAHLLAFGGTRTSHRLVCAIEDAGFEIRDTIAWLYGSGFPKSLNLDGDRQGWGTALKPAHEPIVVARKPLAGTVAANVLAHGTGALNIDECRIGASDFAPKDRVGAAKLMESRPWQERQQEEGRPRIVEGNDLGRWPANVVLDPEAAAMLDKQTGEMRDGGATNHNRTVGEHSGNRIYGERANGTTDDITYGGSGGASRFFYCAKSSTSERSAGLDGDRNIHPTCKPVSLMRWLCRLVTPPSGLILDPFAGSGTTGIAAVLEGFRFVGIEREAEYVAIAETRIAHWAAQPRQMELAS